MPIPGSCFTAVAEARRLYMPRWPEDSILQFTRPPKRVLTYLNINVAVSNPSCFPSFLSNATFTARFASITAMSNPLDLAGVIGTWVAVFLALAALLGLLPAYFIYKRSRSENAAAIAAIDDPRREFVSGLRIRGVVLTQTFNIPDLRKPPAFSVFEKATIDRLPNVSLLGHSKSKTAWVEFSQLINVVFPGFEVGGKSLLLFEQGEAHLPVHKTWLLALGILHRYSVRLDHGLPLGAVMNASADGVLAQEARLSGLSGYLDYRELPPSAGQYDQKYSISFEMHELSSIRDSFTPDHFSFLSLALLFKGYVIRDQETLLRGRIASRESRSTMPQVIEVVARIKSTEFRAGGLRVLPGINAHAKRELGFEIGPIPKDVREDCQPKETTVSALRRHGFYRLGNWHQQGEYFEIWTLKKDAVYFVHGYLEQSPSPYGFLFDVEQDLVVRRMLKTDAIRSTLNLAKIWCAKLSEQVLTVEKRDQLRRTLEQMSQGDLTVRWSRRAMQEIVSVEKCATLIAQHESMQGDRGSVMWNSIRALYACDEGFQQILSRYFDALDPVIENGLQERISFDIQAGTINVPLDGGFEFEFDFNNLFSELVTGQVSFGGTTTIPPAVAVFACLQGQLRATAWKMSFSPTHLQKLDNEIRDLCYVSMEKFHWSSSESNARRRWSRAESWLTRVVESLAQRSDTNSSIHSMDDTQRRLERPRDNMRSIPMSQMFD